MLRHVGNNEELKHCIGPQQFFFIHILVDISVKCRTVTSVDFSVVKGSLQRLHIEIRDTGRAERASVGDRGDSASLMQMLG